MGTKKELVTKYLELLNPNPSCLTECTKKAMRFRNITLIAKIAELTKTEEKNIIQRIVNDVRSRIKTKKEVSGELVLHCVNERSIEIFEEVISRLKRKGIETKKN